MRVVAAVEKSRDWTQLAAGLVVGRWFAGVAITLGVPTSLTLGAWRT